MQAASFIKCRLGVGLGFSAIGLEALTNFPSPVRVKEQSRPLFSKFRSRVLHVEEHWKEIDSIVNDEAVDERIDELVRIELSVAADPIPRMWTARINIASY